MALIAETNATANTSPIPVGHGVVRVAMTGKVLDLIERRVGNILRSA
jgi:hypothetical protein